VRGEGETEEEGEVCCGREVSASLSRESLTGDPLSTLSRGTWDSLVAVVMSLLIGEEVLAEPFSTTSDEEDCRELEEVVLEENFLSLLSHPAWSCDLRVGSEVERLVPGRLEEEVVVVVILVVNLTSSSSSLQPQRRKGEGKGIDMEQ